MASFQLFPCTTYHCRLYFHCQRSPLSSFVSTWVSLNQNPWLNTLVHSLNPIQRGIQTLIDIIMHNGVHSQYGVELFHFIRLVVVIEITTLTYGQQFSPWNSILVEFIFSMDKIGIYCNERISSCWTSMCLFIIVILCLILVTTQNIYIISSTKSNFSQPIELHRLCLSAIITFHRFQ